MTESLDYLNDALKTRRLELGMRYWRDLSTAAGISYETLRALRRGEGQPDDATINGLNRALRYKNGAGIERLLNHQPPEPREPELPATPRELAEHVERRLAEQEERQDAKMAKITEALRSVLGDNATERLLETLDEPADPPATEGPGRRTAG